MLNTSINSVLGIALFSSFIGQRGELILDGLGEETFHGCSGEQFKEEVVWIWRVNLTALTVTHILIK